MRGETNSEKRRNFGVLATLAGRLLAEFFFFRLRNFACSFGGRCAIASAELQPNDSNRSACS